MSTNNCNPCNDCDEVTATVVQITPPPDCDDGEPCAEVYPGTCVKYKGETLTWLGIQADDTYDTIITKLVERMEECCDGVPPVVDCAVSDWGPWSACIGSSQTRTRVVIQEAINGGAVCPVLEETRACVADCVIPEFTLSSPSCTSILVTIDIDDAQPVVNIQYREEGGIDPTWIVLGTAHDSGDDNTIPITGLEEDTNYEVRVRTVCSEDEASVWTIIEQATAAC